MEAMISLVSTIFHIKNMKIAISVNIEDIITMKPITAHKEDNDTPFKLNYPVVLNEFYISYLIHFR